MATSIIETITPVKAQEYLNTSNGNRNISRHVVSSYAKTMKAGQWILNGESIVFDIEGRLINGHHRLHACIVSGVPFETFVTRGISSSAFTTYDCGRHRTVGQLIGMQGYKHYNTISSILHTVQSLINGSVTNNDFSKIGGKTNSVIMEIFMSDPEGYSEAAQKSRDISGEARIIDNSFLGGSIYYLTKFCGYDKEEVEPFFISLCSLESCENEMIEKLRKRLISEKIAKTKSPNRRTICALIIKVWNAIQEGKTLKTIKYQADAEAYPVYKKRNTAK